jgi:hypothetical protein
MQLILDRAVRTTRVRFCRLSFPALVLGLCALTCLQQAALGQAQMGAAEAGFEDGPDKLPAIPKTSIPSMRAEMPAQIAQLLQPVHALPVHSPPVKIQAARPAHALSQNSRARSGVTMKKKAPEGTLTAAR